LKIKLTRRRLLDAVGFARAAVSGKSTLTILSHLLIVPDINAGRLFVSGTDIELWLDASVPCEFVPEMDDVEGEMSFTVAARVLGETLSALGEGEVTISRTAGSNKVLLQSARSKFELLGLPAEEFPGQPAVESPALRTMPGKLFKGMLSSVAYAMSGDATRIVLMGVNIALGEQIRFTATDTHSLATAVACGYKPAPGDNDLAATKILPHRAVGELIKNLPDDGDTVLKLAESQLAFSWQKGEGADATTYSLTSRAIEGAYPHWERIVPINHTKALTIDREEALAALKRTLIVTRDASARVVLETRGMQLRLSGQSSSVGEVEEMLDVAREGDDIHMAFNNRYFINALGALTTQGVTLQLTDPLRPIVIRPSQGGEESLPIDWLGVLMPMQII
jgi:DNA polymerase III subunit beta